MNEYHYTRSENFITKIFFFSYTCAIICFLWSRPFQARKTEEDWDVTIAPLKRLEQAIFGEYILLARIFMITEYTKQANTESNKETRSVTNVNWLRYITLTGYLKVLKMKYL